jgi:hypothetical protein
VGLSRPATIGDVSGAEEWIAAYAVSSGKLEIVHERQWAIVGRVPLAEGIAWFKACAPLQGFEPRLTARLFARWPDRVPQVLACDEERGWLLLADAGTPVGALGNPPSAWLAVLPRYAELQQGEAGYAAEHLASGVPDLRLGLLPTRFEELMRLELPLAEDEIEALRRFAPRFGELCEELAALGVPESVQHDDLHHGNLYVRGHSTRVLDWGDSSIGHPFASLVVTFRFLEERTGLAPGDPWFARLRDAYLEPWGTGFGSAFALAYRVGSFSRAIAYVSQRAALHPEARPSFDGDFAVVLRRALAQSDWRVRLAEPPNAWPPNHCGGRERRRYGCNDDDPDHRAEPRGEHGPLRPGRLDLRARGSRRPPLAARAPLTHR